MAGYSGTPLARKLGIREGHTVLFLRPPEDLEANLEPLPDDVRLLHRAGRGKRYDVTLAFCKRKRDLEELLPRGCDHLRADGGLWLCWPKRTSGVQTDLGEADVRSAGLATGLVDVKICAVDDTWSGLRFVVRKERRGAWPV